MSSRPYWASLAKAYESLGPPLRPAREDVAQLEAVAAGLAAKNAGARVRVLMLGVTRDLAAACWPASALVLAVDSSTAMVAGVWPSDIPGRRLAVCGDWLRLPCRESGFHLAVGDGSANCVRYPGALQTVARALRGALCPNGIAALRCYVQPDEQESPDAVLEEMYRGAIPTFCHLKFRLLMALQPSARQGVAVADVYRFWASRSVDVSRTGWPAREVETIELYKDKDTVHTFPTMTEFREVFSECFEEVSVLTPSYSLGERCPTLVLRPRREA